MPGSALLRLLEKVGLFYLVALGVALASLAGFAKLANERLEASLHTFDSTVLLWVHQHVQAAWTPYVLELTALGSPLGITLVGVLFGVLLLVRRKPWDAVTLLVLMLGSGALTYGLKHLFRQPRPNLFSPLAMETGYGFPSGHALLSVCLYGYAACWIVAQNPRAWWRWLIGAMFVGLAGLISLSRLYLGVHWPTDVVAGWLVAIFWLSSCLIARRWIASSLGH